MADELDNIVSGISSEMPETTDAFIEGTIERDAEPVVRDRDGREFDPAIHKTDQDGNPVYNADGTIKKKRGRRAGSLGSSVGQSTDGAQEKARNTGYVELGHVSATLLCNTAIAIFGEDWEPHTNKVTQTNERDFLAQSFAAYYQAKNMPDLPPGAMLAVALSAYALPRLATSAPTRAKLKVMWEGCKAFWKRLFNRKKKEA